MTYNGGEAAGKELKQRRRPELHRRVERLGLHGGADEHRGRGSAPPGEQGWTEPRLVSKKAGNFMLTL